MNVLAHGVGERGDLPLPATALAIGGAAAVVISAIALMAAWHKADFLSRVEGRRLVSFEGGVARRLAQILLGAGWLVGLAMFVITLVAAFTVTDNTAENIAIRMVYVFYWVIIPLASVVLGDLYRLLSPFEAIARLRDRVVAGRGSEDGDRDDGGQAAEPMWWVALGLLVFLWLELAYHDGSSARALGWLLVAYVVWMLIGVAGGGQQWLRANDPLAVWTSLGSTMSPLRWSADGLYVRPPLVGLSAVRARRGLAAVVLVVLAGTSFDGVSRTRFWRDTVADASGWSVTLLNTVGLLFTIAVAAAIYAGAIIMMRRISGSDRADLEDQLAISLIPVAVGYAVAHYFSLAIFEGHFLLVQASDPFGTGADWFGTRTWRPNYRSVGPTGIARAQAIGIIGGHLAGVIVGHERAVNLLPTKRSVEAQWALIAAMALFTMVGLLLMVNA